MSYDMDFLNSKEVKTSKHEEDDDEDSCSDEECTLCNKDACLSFLKEQVSLGLSPSFVIKRAEEAGCIPELLESEEGSKYRPYYYLSSEMDSLLKRDDGDEFASFLTTNHDLILKFPPHEIFKTICNKGAAACAAAYLQSPPHPHHVPDKDEHYRLAQYCLNFGLSHALHSQHYNLYQVLYSYAARAAAFPHDNHLLESHLSELWYSRNLQRWKPDDPESFFKLIHFFCSPELKGARDLIKWLASNTKQLEQLCLKFIEKGEIISLAALLIVSRDSLLMPSSSEEGGGDGDLEDTPIMRSILEASHQDHLGFNNENWMVGLRLIHTLWRARHVLDRYCSSRSHVKERFVSFDIASDLIHNVGPVHELSHCNFIDRLRPKFTSKLEELSRSDSSRSNSRSFVTKPTMNTHSSDLPAGIPVVGGSCRLSHTWQAVNSNTLKPVQNQLSERTLWRLASCNVITFARICASATWIVKRSIK